MKEGRHLDGEHKSVAFCPLGHRSGTEARWKGGERHWFPLPLPLPFPFPFPFPFPSLVFGAKAAVSNHRCIVCTKRERERDRGSVVTHDSFPKLATRWFKKHFVQAMMGALSPIDCKQRHRPLGKPRSRVEDCLQRLGSELLCNSNRGGDAHDELELEREREREREMKQCSP